MALVPCMRPAPRLMSATPVGAPICRRRVEPSWRNSAMIVALSTGLAPGVDCTPRRSRLRRGRAQPCSPLSTGD